jgi:splicing factor 45
MEKQGWKAGQGLGRDGTGITKAIQMVSSGKKGQPGRGKIVDKNKKRSDPSAVAASEVVVMRGIVDGKRDVEHAELLQKVGDEYKRYGRVVQIVIRWEDEIEEEGDREKARVYVLFADAGSALMVSFLHHYIRRDTRANGIQAVNGLQRREIFEGNKTTTEFYSKEKFEEMVFE